jgi:hypothetical protein
MNDKDITPTHYCSQEETIKRINLILIGNGHPEDGLAFKVLHMAKTHESILTSLKDINGSVKELSEKYDTAINASKTAINAIETYKNEVAQFQKGKEEVIKELDKNTIKSHSKTIKVLQLIGIIVAVLMLCVTTYNSFKKSKTTNVTAKESSVYRNYPTFNKV